MAFARTRALTARLTTLPRWATLTLGTAVVIGTIAAAVFGYRTWDYVEHDNDFCLSCHLMAEPYEQFAESAHRGLGCKACHDPDLMGRSQMALTQILENPDSLGVHAEVPNERCESCHVDGDPDAWRQIAASAGHRVHFESGDSALAGLQCVGCHSSSVHEFAATDQTCGQSGCHEDTEVRLGRMGDLTIHCVACHEFTRPAAAVADGPDAELQPGGAECLSCHAMRRLVGVMPPDEPHGGACGACHDPHEQTTPAQAVESCGEAGCHAASETLTPMHRGLPTGALENCTLCHAAHDSELEEPDCTACHVNPEGRAVPPPPPGGTAAARVGQADAHGRAAARRSTLTLLSRVVAWVGPAPAGAQQARPPPASAPDAAFTHAQHADVGCLRCHSREEAHGTVTVRTRADCRDCHHAEPLAGECVACHPPVRLRGAASLTRALGMPIAETPPAARALEFDHGAHERQACGACHAEGPDRSAQSASCAACHADHHDPSTRCSACHRQAPASAHPVAAVHLTCGGSGCHGGDDFPTDPPGTRSVCLVCHQALVDHEPGQRCGACHALSDRAP